MAERTPLWAPSGASDPDAIPTARRAGFSVRVEVHAPRWDALRQEIEDLGSSFGLSGAPAIPVYLHAPQVLKVERYDQALVVESDVGRWAAAAVTCAAIVASPMIALLYQARMVLEVAGLLARPDQREYALRGMKLKQPWLEGNDTEALTMQIALANLAAHSDLSDIALSILRNAADSSSDRQGVLQGLVFDRTDTWDGEDVRLLCNQAIDLCASTLRSSQNITSDAHQAAAHKFSSGTSSSLTRLSDEELLHCYTENQDSHAFKELLKRHGDFVYQIVNRFMGPGKLEAEDICQQVFMEAARDASRFSRQTSVRNWLVGIAIRRALDARKSNARRWQRIDANTLLDELPATTLDPLESVERSEAVLALGQALDELPDAIRTTVLLRFQDGLSYEEMSQILGQKPDVLVVRVARALPVLRQALERRGTKVR